MTKRLTKEEKNLSDQLIGRIILNTNYFGEPPESPKVQHFIIVEYSAISNSSKYIFYDMFNIEKNTLSPSGFLMQEIKDLLEFGYFEIPNTAKYELV